MIRGTYDYKSNAKKSKELCIELEKLISKSGFDKKLLRMESYYYNVIRISEIREQLETLWDKQIDLFFKNNLIK